MRHALIDNSLWAAGLFSQVALVVVLLCKGRWRDYSCFAGLIALPMLVTLVLLLARWSTSYKWYGRVYLAYAVLDFIFQLGVVVELARTVLRPTGTWVRDARKQFILSAAAGTLLALVLAYLVVPPAATRTEGLELRANLFTSLLICELFIAVSLASNRLGLGWRNHVMAIGQGFMAWSVVATVIDSLHSYFGSTYLYDTTESIKTSAYLLVLWYWSVQLWHDEPARQPLDPELLKFIVALHKRVQYDLGEAER